MDVLFQINAYLQQGSSTKIKELVKKALDQGISAEMILYKGLLKGISALGEKFSNNEIHVPEVLIAARTMNTGMTILKPMLATTHVESRGIVFLGTIKGDLHDIGKNLVKIMPEVKGINVIDLGTDVEPKNFVETAINENVI